MARKIKLYHISPKKNRDSILKYGLLPKQKSDGHITYEPRIFFSKKKTDISVMDFLNQWDNVDVWEVKIDEDLIKKDTNSHLGYHFFTEKPISVKNLRLSAHINAHAEIENYKLPIKSKIKSLLNVFFAVQ
jgi:hypothetical protein